MTDHESAGTEGEDDVVVEQGRLVGCRGRVLVALLVLTALLALLLLMMVRGMLSETQSQPTPRASSDPVTREVAGEPISGLPLRS